MANPHLSSANGTGRPGGDSFEVVAIDTDDRTIEIQYFDGTIEELELEEWLEDQIEASERQRTGPARWTSSPRTPRTSTRPSRPARRVGDPLQSLDRGEVAGYSELELSETPDEADRY